MPMREPAKRPALLENQNATTAGGSAENHVRLWYAARNLSMNAGPTLQPVSATDARDETIAVLRSSAGTQWILSVILFVGVFLLYGSMSRYEFINYDDQLYVTENYTVQHGLTLHGVKWAFTTFRAANWHPVTWLSHMLDVELFGVEPAAHHYVNVFLHSVNAVLVFWLLWSLTKRLGRSFTVATLFAAHPLSVESVMWIAERKNLLCTLFFLLAVAAYAWYVRKPDWKRYVTVTALYLLALLSKPMVVTFPFVLLLLDYWPLDRLERRGASSILRVFAKLVVEKIPWFLMSLLGSILTMIAQTGMGAVSAGYVPLGMRIGNALLSYGRYLWKIVFPVRLCIFYPHPKSALSWSEVILASSVVLLITLLVIRYRARSYLTVGWLWFLGMLVPVIGIVQAGSQAMADRYAYLPFIGILLATVWGASDVLQKFRASQYLILALTCILVTVLGWRTRVQESYWQNSVALFSHALKVTKDNPVAHVSLATALAEKGLTDEAISHIRAVLAINPHDAVALQALALYHIYNDDNSRALTELNEAASYAKYPDLRERIHVNLGALYSKLGNMEKAKSEYREAIAAQPEDYKPYLNLGVHLYLEGSYNEAQANLNQSIAIFPRSTTYYYLGQTLQAEGKLREAGEAYGKALELSPGYDDARRALQELSQRMQSSDQRR
jgi:hypothetical protein